MNIAINYFSTFFFGSYNLLLTAFGRCFGGMGWHNQRVGTTITFEAAVVFGPDWPRQVYNEKVRDLLVPMNSSLVQRSGTGDRPWVLANYTWACHGLSMPQITRGVW